VIAQSSAAQAFLNATTPAPTTVAPAAPSIQLPSSIAVPVIAATPAQPQTKGATTMTTQTIGHVNTPAAAAAKGPSVRIVGTTTGTIQTPVVGQTANALSANRYTSSADASQTMGGSMMRVSYTPWYLQAGDKVITGAEVDNNIVEVTLPNGSKEVRLRNTNLGIDLVAINIVDLYNAGRMKFLPTDYQLIIELKMANDSVVIPFQIGIYGPGYNRYNNDVTYGRKTKATPIFANNIKRVEFGGRWTSELMLSTKNEKSYVVKCSCGAQNTIDPKNLKQVKDGDKVIQTVATQVCYKDDCKKSLTVAEIAQDANGQALEFRSQGYTQRRLPFGFQFGEEVLAQVMAFAHVVLEPDFTLGK
jgi:hypothetical protein